MYFVYKGHYNPADDTVSLLRLIYIGESDKVGDRIRNHEKRPLWLKYIHQDNELVFTTGKTECEDRFRVEAAYIFRHKPPVNTEYVLSFPFDQTTVISSGKLRCLTLILLFIEKTEPQKLKKAATTRLFHS